MSKTPPNYLLVSENIIALLLINSKFIKIKPHKILLDDAVHQRATLSIQEMTTGLPLFDHTLSSVVVQHYKESKSIIILNTMQWQTI